MLLGDLRVADGRGPVRLAQLFRHQSEMSDSAQQLRAARVAKGVRMQSWPACPLSGGSDTLPDVLAGDLPLDRWACLVHVPDHDQRSRGWRKTESSPGPARPMNAGPMNHLRGTGSVDSPTLASAKPSVVRSFLAN